MLRVEGTFGARLRKLRQERGWTQAEFARRASVRERQIIRWENDQHKPRFDHVSALAQTLEVPATELMDALTDEPDEESDPMGDLMVALNRWHDHRASQPQAERATEKAAV